MRVYSDDSLSSRKEARDFTNHHAWWIHAGERKVIGKKLRKRARRAAKQEIAHLVINDEIEQELDSKIDEALEKSYAAAAAQYEADYWKSIQEESDDWFDEQLSDHFDVEEDYYDDVG